MAINIGQLLGDFGLNVDDDVLANSLRAWEQKVFEAAKRHAPEAADELKFSTRVPLHVLPVREQASLVAEYRRIIGLDYVLESLGEQYRNAVPDRTLSSLRSRGFSDERANRIGRIWSSLTQIKGMNEGNTYGMFPDLGGGNALIDRIYRSMNIQFRPYLVEGISGVPDVKHNMHFAGASNYFTFGRRSIHTVDSMISSSYTDSLPDLSGKTVTVFDIETAGIVNKQIREIAWTKYGPSANGVLTGGISRQAVMRPGQFSRGRMIIDGNPVTLEQYASRKLGVRIPAKARIDSGVDFIEQVSPFLRSIEESDYIVGHNISKFDIEQVFTSLAGTRRYRDDREFASYVDNLYNKVRTSTIDTLELVRSNKELRGLTVARALGPDGRAYSIENLLLKTNLASLIGFENLEKAGVLQTGLHSGRVDALITTGILNNIDKLKKSDLLRYTRNSKHSEFVKNLHKMIVSSSAITPWTNITDSSAIDETLKRRFGSDIKLTALEQQILLERNLSDVPGQIPSLSLRELSQNTNVFERIRNQGVNEAQKHLRLIGTPFAGLSMEERALGTRLSKVTSTLIQDERAVAGLATDTLVSRFETIPFERLQLQARTGRATIPTQILEDLGLLRQGESILSLSTVEPTEYNGRRAVNLVLELDSQKNVNKLADRIEQIANDRSLFSSIMGIGDEGVYESFRRDVLETDFLENLRRSGLKAGVTVGQVYDNQHVVSGIFKTLQDFFISDQLKDSQTRRIGMMYAGKTEDGRFIRTAGTFLNRFLTDEDKAGLKVGVSQALDSYKSFEEIAQNPTLRLLANMYSKATGESAELVKSISDTYIDKVRPNLPKAGLGALIGGAALLLYNRKKEKDQYDIIFDRQEANDTTRYLIADYVQMGLDAGHTGAQYMDPLATASIVSNLNSARVGHSSMAWDRNNALYGGLL